METTIAAEIMSNELLSARVETTVEEALKTLVNNKITGMPVVDAEGKMIGVVSEYDLLKQIAAEKKFEKKIFQQPIQFTADSQFVRENTPLGEIVDRFVNAKFRRLPVLNKDGKLVGIITRRDLIRVFYYRATLS